jgi:hypothetical protein
MSSISDILKRLERHKSGLPFAVVTFSDGTNKRLDICQIASIYYSGQRSELVSVEWPSSPSIVCQAVSGLVAGLESEDTK